MNNISLKTDTHLTPQFLSNFRGNNVFNFLEKELNNCDEFFMSVAFITQSGITPFLQTLKELEEKGVKGKILTTDYLSFSQPAALDILDSLHNIELRMYETTQSGNSGFHTKGYLFKKDENFVVIIGSSNLTQSALFRNYEWNVKCSVNEDSNYIQGIREEFDSLWAKSSRYALCKEKYKEAYLKNTLVRDDVKHALKNLDSATSKDIRPNDMQKCFISNLTELIKRGAKRALLISATGTGKTYASALAVKNILQSKKGKVLFVSHREQINLQARKSYQRIFGSNCLMGMLSGNSNDVMQAKKCDFLFSTVQTISKEAYLHQFPRNYYSIIILDECHRVGADSYQTIINYFNPNLLLGMSASPERSDDFDVFKTFHYNIAYEIRLQQALENDLLCPFHYFGITDLEVEEKNVDLNRFNKLASDERVDYIISKAKYYGYSGNKLKGLVFCSTKEEARLLSAQFNNKKRGYRTMALSGEDSQEKRKEAISRLESDDPERSLDYIFTVDIFNEGVDIPQINQILLLRPTQSPIIFVQQVGRGLRKYIDKEYVVILDFIGNYTNNYMIPIALSGDRSGNKDNIRRCLLEPNNLISGASTIHFDSIARERIYASIDTAVLNSTRQLKDEYKSLKLKLGRIPNLEDFDSYGELDPLRIISKCGSYYDFLVAYEPDYNIRLNSVQNEMVNFISSKLVAGKRVQELLLLDILVNGQYERPFMEWKRILEKDYHIKCDKIITQSVINVLTNEFYGVGSTKEKYKHCIFLTNEGDVHPSFVKELRKSEFKDMILELLDFGLKRNAINYQKSGTFVLYKKYTYDDVCRLLNWEKNVVANSIGGYFYDERTNTFPVFINYNKADDISESINYEDRFVDNETIIALSKNRRTRESKEVQRIIHSAENKMQILLFLRKNKDDKESKEFYYLGNMKCTDNITDVKMSNGDNAVEIEYKLDKPVEDNLYEYLLMN